MNAHQTSHRLMRQELYATLRAIIDSARIGSEIDPNQLRTSAALYVLLRAHPVDTRGRCRSCRGRGGLPGRRRRVCRVYLAARYYLHQPDNVVLRHVATELEQQFTDVPRIGARHTLLPPRPVARAHSG